MALQSDCRTSAGPGRDRAAMTAIDTFINAIETGTRIPSSCYAENAVLDATVPNWRLSASGPDAIATEYGRWFAHPGRFEELERRPTSHGEVVTYLLAWEENGVPHAAHHCHVLSLAPDGRIARDEVWCGGRWDASLLAQMGAPAHAG